MHFSSRDVGIRRRVCRREKHANNEYTRTKGATECRQAGKGREGDASGRRKERSKREGRQMKSSLSSDWNGMNEATTDSLLLLLSLCACVCV